MSKLIWTFEPDGKIFYQRPEEKDTRHYFGTASAVTGHIYVDPDLPFPIARYIPLWGPQSLIDGLAQAAKEMPGIYKAMHEKVREHLSKEVKTEVNPLMVMIFLLFTVTLPLFSQSSNSPHPPKEEYVVVPKSILSPEQGRHVKQTFEENDYKNMLEFANGIVIIVTEMAKGFAQSVGDFAATPTGKFLISIGTVYVFKNELILLMAFPLFWCIFFVIAFYMYRVLFKKIRKKEIASYRIDTTSLKLFPRYNIEYENPDSDYRTMFYTYLIAGSIIETIITAFIVVNLVT